MYVVSADDTLALTLRRSKPPEAESEISEMAIKMTFTWNAKPENNEPNDAWTVVLAGNPITSHSKTHWKTNKIWLWNNSSVLPVSNVCISYVDIPIDRIAFEFCKMYNRIESLSQCPIISRHLCKCWNNCECNSNDCQRCVRWQHKMHHLLHFYCRQHPTSVAANAVATTIPAPPSLFYYFSKETVDFQTL